MGARGLPGYSDASHIGRTTTVAFYSLAPTRQHSNPPRFPENSVIRAMVALRMSSSDG